MTVTFHVALACSMVHGWYFNLPNFLSVPLFMRARTAAAPRTSINIAPAQPAQLWCHRNTQATRPGRPRPLRTRVFVLWYSTIK